MLWVMLKGIASTTVPLGVGAVTAIADVGIAVEIVVIVDVDLIAPPTTTPPAAAPGSPHGHSNSERNRHPRGVIPRRGIVDWRIGIGGRAVNHCGVVTRNVDHLRIRLLNNNHLFIFDGLRFHLLLLG